MIRAIDDAVQATRPNGAAVHVATERIGKHGRTLTEGLYESQPELPQIQSVLGNQVGETVLSLLFEEGCDKLSHLFGRRSSIRHRGGRAPGARPNWSI